MRKLIELPSFNGVGAGQTATLDLPTIDRYDQMRMKYGTSTAGGATAANVRAEISEIRAKVNGKVQRRMTGGDLIDINAYHGVDYVTDGILPIIFAEHWRREAAGEDVLGWNMGDVQTFQLEVDIANNGGQTPTLSATALKTPSNLPMGAINKWRKFNVPVSATGQLNLQNLPKIDSYYALHAKTANIDQAKVLVDQEEIVNATPADLHDLYERSGGFNPQTGFTHIDFAYTSRVSDALPMKRTNGRDVQDFRIDFNMTVASTFELITETVGLRD